MTRKEIASSAGPTRFVEAAPEKVAPVKSEHEDKTQRPIPEMGWPAIWYRIKKMVHENPVPPKLSKKEQVVADEKARQTAKKQEETRREEARSQGIETLTDLSDEVPSATVVFLGVKGAAATTTTATHVASVAADLTRSTFVFTDLNPASGTGAARLGKYFHQTITLREFLRPPTCWQPLIKPVSAWMDMASATWKLKSVFVEPTAVRAITLYGRCLHPHVDHQQLGQAALNTSKAWL